MPNSDLDICSGLWKHVLPLFCMCEISTIVCVILVELMTSRARQQQRQQQQLLLMNLHLLSNPGDSLLLQHTLDRLLRWLCPSLRIFHVSERASPFRSYTRLCPVAGNYPHCALLHFYTVTYTLFYSQVKPCCSCAFNLISFSVCVFIIISICESKTCLQKFKPF